jgi:hypothetical protein
MLAFKAAAVAVVTPARVRIASSNQLEASSSLLHHYYVRQIKELNQNGFDRDVGWDHPRDE